MTKVVYNSAQTSFKKADIDCDTVTFKVQMVDADYTYSAAHDFLDDVPAGARIGTATALATVTVGTVAAGVIDAANTSISTVAGGDTVTGYIIYNDTPAAESGKHLICFADEDAAGASLSVGTNGGAITFTWSASGIFK